MAKKTFRPEQLVLVRRLGEISWVFATYLEPDNKPSWHWVRVNGETDAYYVSAHRLRTP